MNKVDERKVLDSVFGGFGLLVAETEEPDFVCSKVGVNEFGVEVTEFFLTESDARLSKIRNYGSELLAGGKYRHKDDVRQIKVEDVVYCRPSTGQKIPMKAIPRAIPSHRESITKVLAAIAEKNRKYPRYKERVQTTDLIVSDTDSVLRFQSIRQLLEPIVFPNETSTILASPFREVYIVTANHEKGSVFIPVKANLFVGEIGLFSGVFRTFQEEAGSQTTVGHYLRTLSTYLAARFPGAMYFTKSDVPHFVFGSVSWTFTPDQRIEVADISLADSSNWTRLADEVDNNALPSKLQQMANAAREEELAVCELYLQTVSPPNAQESA